MLSSKTPSPASAAWRWCFAFLCFCPSLGFATLVWEQERIEATPPPGEKVVSTTFRFVNSGNAPIAIIAVESDCSCTTAELGKRTYAPKEAGEIKAVFTIGDRTGLQEKTIRVTTDDAPANPTALVWRVNLPELLSFSVRALIWSTAEGAVEKSVMVTSAGPQKITAIETVAAAAPEASSRIEAITPGSKYRISITPASTRVAGNLSVGFIARFADGSVREFPVYVLVR